MRENHDYITKEENQKIKEIALKNNLSLAAVGRLCEIQDRSFWKRLMDGAKPLPEHSRNALNEFFQTYKED